MHYDVILTDAANSVGRLVKRSLERLGFKVAVCDPHPGTGADFRTFHSQDEENFISQIERIVSDTEASILLPVFYPEVIASHKDRFPSVSVPVEDASKIKLLDDKVSACALAAELGIPQPRIIPCADDVIDFPVVFKRSGGHGGASVYFPARKDSLQNLVSNSAEGKYLITEMVEGEDVSVDGVRFGDYYVYGAYRTLLPKAKGASVVRESICAPRLGNYLRIMLEHIDYNGVCGADFRVDADGREYFLECNPRFCGGLDTLLASGLDLPGVFFAAYNGGCPSAPEYVAGRVTGLSDDIANYLENRKRHGRLNEEDLILSSRAEQLF